MKLETTSIQTRTEKIWLDESGIAYAVLFPEYTEFEDGIRFIEGLKKIGEGNKVCTFVDIRLSEGASHQSRKYIGIEGKEVFKGLAILANSPFTKMMANFFVGFAKPEFPVKVFQSKTNAIQWLKNLDKLKKEEL